MKAHHEPCTADENTMIEPNRCPWCGTDPLYIEYHDKEWGVPVYDNQTLFEFLILEGAQAGLSWITVLRKRENYRKAFDNFNPEKIARYTDVKKAKLLLNEGIIRNRLKIDSAVKNAHAYMTMKKNGEDFSTFLWSFVGGKTIDNKHKTTRTIAVSTPESDAMSKALKQKGFNFVGTTICYAFMQATGMVNDHIQSCHKYRLSKRK
jgi:DNA-3-methyladenine glycosylase I